MDRKRLSESLIQLPIEELVAVLQKVFNARAPFPEESDYCRNRFYLGVAYSDLLSRYGEDVVWGKWKFEGVAYPAGNDLGPDYGLCQSGVCGSCQFAVRSNVKQGVCPVCYGDVYMT